jgi:ABC-type sulfate transport system permease subunit
VPHAAARKLLARRGAIGGRSAVHGPRITVAVGIGEFSKATNTLGLLAVNVVMMVLGAVMTLVVQRALRRRRSAARDRATRSGEMAGSDP